MNEKFIGRIFSDKDLEKIVELLKNKDFSGWFGNTTGGKYLQKFEKNFAKFCGVERAFTTSSGTTAIYTALRALGLDPMGSSRPFVAVPTFTHIGTVAPIVAAGSRPLFIDVDKYGALDPEDLKKYRHLDLKAVIVQHFLGMPCQMGRIRSICGDSIPIIEDASLALGSSYYNKMAGALGDIGAFSIGGGRTKIICAGEGGIVTTNNPSLADKVKHIRNHGDRYGDEPYFCFNFRMSELNALVALCQMNRIDDLLAFQIRNAEYIIKRLPKYLRWLGKPDGVKPNYYIIGCEFDADKAGMSRNDWLRKITSDPILRIGRGIPRRSINGGYSKLIHEVEYYRRFTTRNYPNSEFLRNNIVWIDWHRFPRTIKEIDELLQVMDSIA